MHNAHHRMSELFKQLGLLDTDAQIQSFLAKHRHLPARCLLADADFWTESQANFLRDAVAQDSDWSVIVDQLSQALRSGDD